MPVGIVSPMHTVVPIDRKKPSRPKPPAKPTSVHVVAWPDPTLDSSGHDPRSFYVERFWLPLLGPTSVFLLRNMAASFESQPDGFDLEFAPTATQIGLGRKNGNWSPMQRSLRRLITLGLAAARDERALMVRRFLPIVSPRFADKLTKELREEHDRWLATVAANDSDPEVSRLRWRARRIALGLIALDDDFATVEAELLAWHLHPALAWDAADWAWRQANSGSPAGSPSETTEDAGSVTSLSRFGNAQFT
jgi:hypothetical protein